MLTKEIVAQAATPHNIVIESDEIQHIEDTPLWTVIRNGRFIELPWNALTEAEKRAIYINMFAPCELY